MHSEDIHHVVRILRKEIRQWPLPAIGHYVETPFTTLISCILSLRTQDKTTNAAWRSKPSFYAVSTQDRTINPDLERFMAKRMKAKTIEIAGSHLALISHPDAVANLILEALAV